MIKVMFICHGNICRSPMAEFVFRDMVEKRGLADRIQVASSATSREEIGNPVHPGTRRKLLACRVPLREHRAVQLTRKDYQSYDYLVAMDSRNLSNIYRITGGDKAGKVCRLLDFSSLPRDIADPWYTNDFDETYSDIVEGCRGLLEHLIRTPK